MSENGPFPEESELPDGWSLRSLDELCTDIRTGGTPDTDNEDYWTDNKSESVVPWRTSKHLLEHMEGLEKESKYVTQEGLSETTVAESGDVALGCRVNVGRVAHIKNKSAFSQDIKVLKLCNKIDNNYLSKYLLSLKNHYQKLQRGATITGITNEHVKSVVVPVPPLNEQERIVEEVEERLDRIERLERSVENIRRLANEYQDSFTISLFAGLDNLNHNVDFHNLSDSIPDDWEMKNFGEVIQSSLYGCNPETGEDIDGFPYLRISDIREDGGLKYSELPENAKFDKGSDAEKYSLNDGDIVVARTGGRLCGKSYVYEPRHGDMVYASYLIRFKLNTDKVLKEYIKAYLQSPIYWRQVWSGKKPSTSTRQNINAGEIKSFNIPVPPIEKQQDIVYSLRETDYSSIQRASDDLSHLFKEYRESVLASAFRGKIDY